MSSTVPAALSTVLTVVETISTVIFAAFFAMRPVFAEPCSGSFFLLIGLQHTSFLQETEKRMRCPAWLYIITYYILK